MDVSELLAPGPGLSTITIVLIAVAILGAVLAIAAVLLDLLPDSGWYYRILFPGLILLAVGVLGSAPSAYIDVYTSQADRGDMFRSALFDGYGFIAEDPAALWRIVDGESETVTTLSREGVEHGVRIHLDGTRLIITGHDGQEVPANAQLNSEGSN